jgi:hypothetical protein
MSGISEKGGRFLKRSKATGEWIEVEDKLARDKCSHAVRDFANTMAKRGILQVEDCESKPSSKISIRLARVIKDSQQKKTTRKTQKKKTEEDPKPEEPAKKTEIPIAVPSQSLLSMVAASIPSTRSRTAMMQQAASVVSDSDLSSIFSDSSMSDDDEDLANMPSLPPLVSPESMTCRPLVTLSAHEQELLEMDILPIGGYDTPSTRAMVKRELQTALKICSDDDDHLMMPLPMGSEKVWFESNLDEMPFSILPHNACEDTLFPLNMEDTGLDLIVSL